MMDLVDRIYEAAFVPEFWPEVLQAVSDASNSAAGAIALFTSRATPQFISTELIRPILADIDSIGGWQESSVVGLLFSMLPPSCFIYDRDFFPVEAIEANRVRLDRTIPIGIGGQVGSFVALPAGEILLFAIDRWLSNDRPSDVDLAALNGLRPHLARAGLITARLRMERARNTVEALQTIGLPAAVVNIGGRVLVANELLEGRPEMFVPTAFGGLALGHPRAEVLFRQALAALGAKQGAEEVQSIPVPARNGNPAAVIHLLPLNRSARDIFSSGDVVIAATLIDKTLTTPSVSVLTTLFDLTPAEARLASALSIGGSLKVAASKSNITFKTGRTYLERIFAKTGTHRQSELVALLRSAQPLAASPVGWAGNGEQGA